MNLLDVSGDGGTLVNLALVRCVRVKGVGNEGEITFTYGNGEEDVFKVSMGRLVVIDDLLDNLKVMA